MPAGQACASPGATRRSRGAAAICARRAAARRAQPRRPRSDWRFDPAPSLKLAGVRRTPCTPSGCYRKSRRRSGFLETIADAVQRLDHVEVVVRDLELLAQPFEIGR